MTEQNENILEGQIEIPDNKKHLFMNLDAALDFLKWARPSNFQVVTGYAQDGKYVIQLTMENNSL